MKLSTTLNTAARTSMLGTVTVPTGKVWKIESASLVADSINGYPPSSAGVWAMTVDDQIVTGGGGSSNYTSLNTYLPLWLGHGTFNVLVSLTVGTACGTCRGVGTLSVIEYNITP